MIQWWIQDFLDGVPKTKVEVPTYYWAVFIANATKMNEIGS